MNTHIELGKIVYKNIRDSIRESMRQPKIQPVRPEVIREFECKDPVFKNCEDISNFLKSEINFIDIEE